MGNFSFPASTGGAASAPTGRVITLSGLVSDAVALPYIATSAGSTALVTVDPIFAPGDVGKTVSLQAAGTAGALHVTTIASYQSSTHVTMAAPAVLEVDAYEGIMGTDNSTAITNAVNSMQAGDSLYIPKGNYLIKNSLTVKDYTTWYGDGEIVSQIYFTSGDGIVGTDVSNISFRDFGLVGPGKRSISGSGIKFGRASHPALFYLNFARMFISGWGQDGIQLDTPIVSHFERITVFHAKRYGINCFGAGEADGTSVAFTACFMAGNWEAGYRLKQMAYSTLNGCAADSNGVGYLYDTCIGITENGCGTEETYNFDLLGYIDQEINGYSRYIKNSKVVQNSPFMIQNVGIAEYITAGSRVVINEFYEGSPGNADDDNSAPVNALKVDSGCTVVLNGYQKSGSFNLADGTTTIIPDDFAALGGSDLPTVDDLTGAHNSMPRFLAGSAVSMGGSGSLRLSYFTATKDIVGLTKLGISCVAAATGSPTLKKLALFEIDSSGNGTRKALTNHESTLMGTANTWYEFSTTASYNIEKGKRYAVGFLQVAGTVGTVSGSSMAGSASANAVMAHSPRIAGTYGSQTDIPTSFLNADLGNVASIFYMECL